MKVLCGHLQNNTLLHPPPFHQLTPTQSHALIFGDIFRSLFIASNPQKNYLETLRYIQGLGTDLRILLPFLSEEGRKIGISETNYLSVGLVGEIMGQL
jgi:hypothetical protein